MRKMDPKNSPKPPAMRYTKIGCGFMTSTCSNTSFAFSYNPKYSARGTPSLHKFQNNP